MASAVEQLKLARLGLKLLSRLTRWEPAGGRLAGISRDFKTMALYKINSFLALLHPGCLLDDLLHSELPVKFEEPSWSFVRGITAYRVTVGAAM